ncbi:uncharacterized protein [Littorina saxatilis]|uniref:uncharacterized protein n=1 Tax=Littorina saxatilis TaxID=31220 RepID=UPI0038B52D05
MLNLESSSGIGAIMDKRRSSRTSVASASVEVVEIVDAKSPEVDSRGHSPECSQGSTSSTSSQSTEEVDPAQKRALISQLKCFVRLHELDSTIKDSGSEWYQEGNLWRRSCSSILPAIELLHESTAGAATEPSPPLEESLGEEQTTGTMLQEPPSITSPVLQVQVTTGSPRLTLGQDSLTESPLPQENASMKMKSPPVQPEASLSPGDDSSLGSSRLVESNLHVEATPPVLSGEMPMMKVIKKDPPEPHSSVEKVVQPRSRARKNRPSGGGKSGASQPVESDVPIEYSSDVEIKHGLSKKRPTTARKSLQKQSASETKSPKVHPIKVAKSGPEQSTEAEKPPEKHITAVLKSVPKQSTHAEKSPQDQTTNMAKTCRGQLAKVKVATHLQEQPTEVTKSARASRATRSSHANKASASASAEPATPLDGSLPSAPSLPLDLLARVIKKEPASPPTSTSDTKAKRASRKRQTTKPSAVDITIPGPPLDESSSPQDLPSSGKLPSAEGLPQEPVKSLSLGESGVLQEQSSSEKTSLPQAQAEQVSKPQQLAPAGKPSAIEKTKVSLPVESGSPVRESSPVVTSTLTKSLSVEEKIHRSILKPPVPEDQPKKSVKFSLASPSSVNKPSTIKNISLDVSLQPTASLEQGTAVAPQLTKDKPAKSAARSTSNRKASAGLSADDTLPKQNSSQDSPLLEEPPAKKAKSGSHSRSLAKQDESLRKLSAAIRHPLRTSSTDVPFKSGSSSEAPSALSHPEKQVKSVGLPCSPTSTCANKSTSSSTDVLIKSCSLAEAPSEKQVKSVGIPCLPTSTGANKNAGSGSVEQSSTVKPSPCQDPPSEKTTVGIKSVSDVQPLAPSNEVQIVRRRSSTSSRALDKTCTASTSRLPEVEFLKESPVVKPPSSQRKINKPGKNQQGKSDKPGQTQQGKSHKPAKTLEILPAKKSSTVSKTKVDVSVDPSSQSVLSSPRDSPLSRKASSRMMEASKTVPEARSSLANKTSVNLVQSSVPPEPSSSSKESPPHEAPAAKKMKESIPTSKANTPQTIPHATNSVPVVKTSATLLSRSSSLLEQSSPTETFPLQDPSAESERESPVPHCSSATRPSVLSNTATTTSLPIDSVSHSPMECFSQAATLASARSLSDEFTAPKKPVSREELRGTKTATPVKLLAKTSTLSPVMRVMSLTPQKTSGAGDAVEDVREMLQVDDVSTSSQVQPPVYTSPSIQPAADAAAANTTPKTTLRNLKSRLLKDLEDAMAPSVETIPFSLPSDVTTSLTSTFTSTFTTSVSQSGPVQPFDFTMTGGGEGLPGIQMPQRLGLTSDMETDWSAQEVSMDLKEDENVDDMDVLSLYDYDTFLEEDDFDTSSHYTLPNRSVSYSTSRPLGGEGSVARSEESMSISVVNLQGNDESTSSSQNQKEKAGDLRLAANEEESDEKPVNDNEAKKSRDDKKESDAESVKDKEAKKSRDDACAPTKEKEVVKQLSEYQKSEKLADNTRSKGSPSISSQKDSRKIQRREDKHREKPEATNAPRSSRSLSPPSRSRPETQKRSERTSPPKRQIQEMSSVQKARQSMRDSKRELEAELKRNIERRAIAAATETVTKIHNMGSLKIERSLVLNLMHLFIREGAVPQLMKVFTFICNQGLFTQEVCNAYIRLGCAESSRYDKQLKNIFQYLRRFSIQPSGDCLFALLRVYSDHDEDPKMFWHMLSYFGTFRGFSVPLPLLEQAINSLLKHRDRDALSKFNQWVLTASLEPLQKLGLALVGRIASILQPASRTRLQKLIGEAQEKEIAESVKEALPEKEETVLKTPQALSDKDFQYYGDRIKEYGVYRNWAGLAKTFAELCQSSGGSQLFLNDFSRMLLKHDVVPSTDRFLHCLYDLYQKETPEESTLDTLSLAHLAAILLQRACSTHPVEVTLTLLDAILCCPLVPKRLLMNCGDTGCKIMAAFLECGRPLAAVDVLKNTRLQKEDEQWAPLVTGLLQQLVAAQDIPSAVSMLTHVAEQTSMGKKMQASCKSPNVPLPATCLIPPNWFDVTACPGKKMQASCKSPNVPLPATCILQPNYSEITLRHPEFLSQLFEILNMQLDHTTLP